MKFKLVIKVFKPIRYWIENVAVAVLTKDDIVSTDDIALNGKENVGNEDPFLHITSWNV